MKNNKGWLVCLSVLDGLTLANAASASDNADNNQQQTVTTDSNDTNSNVTNSTVATAETTQGANQTIEATTTQANASIPTYLN